MDRALTPEPHYIPGYQGHCPQYMYRIGGTYGQLTHKSLLMPCAGHSKDLILMPTEAQGQLASPTEKELDTLKFREKFLDVVYKDPIIPGYEGFIPRMAAQIGKRFLVAATAGITEHEADMELHRCQRRQLQHSDLLRTDRGLFEQKTGERMMPSTKYKAPLIPIRPQLAANELEKCNIKPEKERYSKFTVPHFMEDNDENKWIVSGYCGHIPMAKMRHGQSSKELSRSALIDFSNLYRRRHLDDWCSSGPPETARTCPEDIDYAVYNDDNGFIPKYAGHVPGHLYKVGLRYALSTANAKGWLRDHRNKDFYEF